jgi:hypothetical protein
VLKLKEVTHQVRITGVDVASKLLQVHQLAPFIQTTHDRLQACFSRKVYKNFDPAALNLPVVDYNRAWCVDLLRPSKQAGDGIVSVQPIKVSSSHTQSCSYFSHVSYLA